MKVINVASKTPAGDLGTKIFNSLEDDEVELKLIGASAVNQAIKAIAIARKQYNVELVCIPSFFSTTIEGEERSGIRLTVRRLV